MLRAGAESCTVPFVTMADEAYCDFIGPLTVRFSALRETGEKVMGQAVTMTDVGGNEFFFSEKLIVLGSVPQGEEHSSRSTGCQDR